MAKIHEIISHFALKEACYIILILFFNYLVIFYLYSDWSILITKILTVPISALSLPVPITEILIGFSIWLWIILIGMIMITVLLKSEKDLTLKWITAVAFGIGVSGWISVLLTILNIIYVSTLISNFIILTILVILYTWSKKTLKKTLKESLHLLITVPLNFIKSKNVLLVSILPLMIYIFIVLHAVFAPIVHWDATVYHALMANVVYLYRGVPLIAGTSHGLEMSANYPPLFYVLGSVFYIIVGNISDIWIKIISPIASLITILATYQIGKHIVKPSYGLFSAFFLIFTPLFILYSIYAVSYMLYIAFLTMSILFLLLALKRKNNRIHYFLSGAFYGFALLTNYEALIISPFYLLIFIYTWIKQRKTEAILFVLSILCFGSPWFLRNWLLLDNPIFPFGYEIFGGKFVSRWIRDIVFNSIMKYSIVSFFNSYNPSLIDYLRGLIFNRINYPIYSFLLPIGILSYLGMKKKNLDFFILLIWSLVFTLPSLIGFKWIYPRAFLSSLVPNSFFAVYPLYRAYIIISKHYVKTSKPSKHSVSHSIISKRNFLLISLIIIIIAHGFFPALVTAIAGNSTYDSAHASPPTSPLSILGIDIPEWYHGQHKSIWDFLNVNLREGDKVATMESKLYYIKHGDPKYFFPLDGFKAEKLYALNSPEDMVEFLKKNNVTYIYDSPWTRGILWMMLPLTKYLGSPWFPLVFSVNPTTLGADIPTIYQVGPYTPISIKSEGLAISLNKYWIIRQHGEKSIAVALSEKANTILSDAPRIYVETPSAVEIRLEYLDLGADWVDVHLYDPAAGKWYYSYTKIPREDTHEWRNYTFVIPSSIYGFITLGIHAYETDYILREIEVRPLRIPGKYSHNEVISTTFTNTTNPPTIMIYLPVLIGNNIIKIETQTQRNISIEIFEGIIQPWITTKWWEKHKLVARAPQLPVFGVRNPSLVWRADPGMYTLLIVLWDEYDPNVEINFSIIIGGSYK